MTFRQRFKGDGRAKHENTWAEGVESSKDPKAGSVPGGVHSGQDGAKGDQYLGAKRESGRKEKAGGERKRAGVQTFRPLEGLGSFSLSEEESHSWRDVSRGAIRSHFCFQRITFGVEIRLKWDKGRSGETS